MTATRGPPRREVDPRKKLPAHNKTLYTDSRTNPSILFNDHVWNPPTDADYDTIIVEYMKGDRLATGYKTAKHAEQHVPNVEVLANANRPPPGTMARIRRMRYLPRLLNHAPSMLLRLLDANAHMDGSWTKIITDDTEWLHLHLSDHQSDHQKPAAQPHPREAVPISKQDPSRSRP